MQVESSFSQNMRKAVRNLREQDRQKRFNQNREEQRKSLNDQGMQKFQEMYRMIDENNIADHLEFFKQYAYNDKYNFMLLAYTPNLCEYLAENCFDETAFYILEALSHFEQIEITWLEEVISSLVGNLKLQGRRVLNIIDNLIDNSRYSQDVRELLLYFNFLEEGKELIQKQTQTGNETELEFISFIYIDICFTMVSRHPLPHISVCSEILEALVPYLRQNFKFRLYEFLNYVAHYSQINQKYGQLLYQQFEKCIQEDLLAFPQQSVNFINYCARSKVKISHKLLKPLVSCLLTKQNWQFSQIMNIFTFIGRSTEQYEKDILYNELERQKAITYVLKFFKNASDSEKIQILVFLQQIIIQLVKTLLQIPQQMACQNYYDENQQQLLSLLLEGIQSESNQLRQSTLQLILQMFVTFQTNHITKQHYLLQLMQSTEIIGVLTYSIDLNKDCQSLNSQILSLYDCL